MTLTPEQKLEAEDMYRRSKLTADEILCMKIIEEADEEFKAAQRRYDEVRDQCPHPLIMRVTENKGNTGNYDRDSDSYWTNHFCKMCSRHWTTNQSWNQIGDGQGHPEDKLAKRGH